MESIVIELSKNKSLCVRIIYQRENMVSFNKGKRDIIKKKKLILKYTTWTHVILTKQF